jgi:putative aldouronate transport system substrate-binding protein
MKHIRRLVTCGVILLMATTALSAQTKDAFRFTYLRPVWGPATHEKGAAYEKVLFEKANVVIDSMIVPVVDYEAKFLTIVAGGNLPDVMWHSGPSSMGINYDLTTQGTFLALDDYLKKYPAVKGAVSDGLWDTVKGLDGKQYFFPSPLSPWTPFPIVYRTDVFKKLGIAEPNTIDELVSALKVIRDRMPDMIPITTHEYTIWYFQNFAPAFGYGFGNWMVDPDNPNRIIPSAITQGHKDFLAWIQMLRKEHLLDPDYMIAKGKLGADKFMAGQAAVMVGHWASMPDWYTQLKKVAPDADVAFMKALKGPRGYMGCRAQTGFDRGFSISSKSKGKAEQIFKFLNWVYTDGYEFMKWGLEGQMYTVDAVGNKVSIPDADRAPGFQRPNWEPFGFPLKSADTLPMTGSDWKSIYDQYKQAGIESKIGMTRTMFEDAAKYAFPNYNRLTFSKTQSEVGSKLDSQYMTPMREKIVIDATAPLSLFDDAVANWLKNGGEKIIAEVNAAQKDKSAPRTKYVYSGRDYK